MDSKDIEIFFMRLNLLIVGYLPVYLATQARSDSFSANGTLQIVILDAEEKPVVGLKVYLCAIQALAGPPDIGFIITDEKGVTTLVMPSGKYKVGLASQAF